METSQAGYVTPRQNRFTWTGVLRALRNARLISRGTRTEEGTRAFGLLASVIETCRKRGISPWPYIAQVVAQRRQCNPAPPLPGAAAT
jgi:hypothetical protein